MNILIISMSHYFGGAEAYLLNLEKLLLPRHKVYIITSSPILKNYSKSRTIYINKSSIFYYINFIYVYFKLIKTIKCKIVILNGARETWCSFLNFKNLYSTIFISHTEIEPLKSKTEPINNLIAIFKSYIKVFLMKRVGNIVCVSKHVYDQFEKISKYSNFEMDNVFLIPNWPNTDFINKENNPFKDSRFHILIVAKLTKSKGHKELLNACKNIENIVLHIVGDGSDYNTLVKSCVGVETIFYGHLSEVHKFYEKCHLLILPSKWEGGNPLCLLEGMAVGIDCAGNNINPIKEIINHKSLFNVNEKETIIKLIKSKYDEMHKRKEKIVYTPNNSYLNLISKIVENAQIKKSTISHQKYDKTISSNLAHKKRVNFTIIIDFNDISFSISKIKNLLFKIKKYKETEIIFFTNNKDNFYFIKKKFKQNRIINKVLFEDKVKYENFPIKSLFKSSKGTYISLIPINKTNDIDELIKTFNPVLLTNSDLSIIDIVKFKTIENNKNLKKNVSIVKYNIGFKEILYNLNKEQFYVIKKTTFALYSKNSFLDFIFNMLVDRKKIVYIRKNKDTNEILKTNIDTLTLKEIFNLYEKSKKFIYEKNENNQNFLETIYYISLVNIWICARLIINVIKWINFYTFRIKLEFSKPN